MTAADLCFLDTNVLVYARDRTEPAKHEVARRWLVALRPGRRARLSYQVVQEYYVVVTRKLRPGLTVAEARADVRDFLAWAPVAPNPAMLEAAWVIQDNYALSWWDCLIVAAARQAHCPWLLSEDLSAGQDYGGVRVLNPFETEPDALLLTSP